MESIVDGRYLADFSLVDQPTIGLRLSGSWLAKAKFGPLSIGSKPKGLCVQGIDANEPEGGDTATATKPPASANGRLERVEGWYPDPKTRPGQRYWDGKEWTEHLAPPGLMLKLCCATGAFAAVGIITAGVLAEIVDSGHVTMAGRIAAISAGLLFATLAVGFVASFYRNRMLKATSELQQPRDAETGQFQSSG